MNIAYGVCGLKPSEFFSLTWGEFNDLSNVRLNFLEIEEEKRHINKGEIMAAIYNTVPRQKGKKGYTYVDFMPDMYLNKHQNNEQLPNSSAEIMRDRIATYNKKHPNDKLKFDYDKFKN